MPEYQTEFIRPPWTAATFEAVVGRPPEQDDLERVNCCKAGTLGHYDCGVSALNGKPMFMANHGDITKRCWLLMRHDK